MNKSTALLVLTSLLILGGACLEPGKTQSQSVAGVVTINSDGSISPKLTQIKQTGNTYALTSDINAHVQIFLKKSNMVFDGNGHVLGDGRVGNIVMGDYSGSGVTNVTIKNFFINQTSTDVITVMNSANISIQNNTLIGAYSIFEQTNGVFLKNSNSVKVIGNTIKGAMCGIDLIKSKDNLIVGNTIDAKSGWTWNHYPAAIMIDVYYAEVDTYSAGSSNNLIYDNAFMSSGNLTNIFGASSNSWDNGQIGNYWSDYLTMYPAAAEVDSSGIGNTPYVIDANNVDNYPLMSQDSLVFPVPILSVPTSTPTTTPTLSSATPTPSTSTSNPTIPEFTSTIILALLGTVTFVATIKKWRVKIRNSTGNAR
jgi:parallel beta-helix repeat protein